MNDLDIWKFADAIFQLSDTDKALIETYTAPVPIKKGTILTDIGSIARNAYLVLDGYMRQCFITSKGKKFTSLIVEPHQIGACHASFANQIPSLESLEAITDCVLAPIPHHVMIQLADSNLDFSILVRKTLEHILIETQTNLLAHLTKTPEERYDWFMEEKSYLFNLIPHHEIAAFLGMSPVSLSRIRARKRKAR